MAFHPRDRLPWNRGLTRRDMLKWTASTTAAGAFLVACGRGDSLTGSADGITIGTPNNPVKQPLYDDNQPIESGLDPEPGPLRLYNWSDYMWTRVIKDFSEEFDVEVESSTFYNLEEATRKLRTGEVNFDVFFPTAEVVPKFVAGKLLQPLNHDYLPNMSNVWPWMADPYYDKGSRYTVPYVTYQTGIGWRVDMVDDDIAGLENPWEALWNSDYKGIVGLYDDYRETIGVGLYKSGLEDINTGKAQDLEEAKNNLVKLVDLVNVRYTIDGAYAKMPEGIFGIHHAWSGDVIGAPQYFPEGGDPSVLRFVWPPNGPNSTAGGYISNDVMSVLKGAEHPVLAHMFINYLLDNAVAEKNFSWLGYQPPLTAMHPATLVDRGLVIPELENAVLVEDDFTKGQVPIQLTPEADRLWLNTWSEVQAGG